MPNAQRPIYEPEYWAVPATKHGNEWLYLKKLVDVDLKAALHKAATEGAKVETKNEEAVEPKGPPELKRGTWMDRAASEIMRHYETYGRLTQFPPDFRIDEVKTRSDELLKAIKDLEKAVKEWKPGATEPSSSIVSGEAQNMIDTASWWQGAVNGVRFVNALDQEKIKKGLSLFMEQRAGVDVDRKNNAIVLSTAPCIIETEDYKFDFGPMIVKIYYSQIWAPTVFNNVVKVHAQMPLVNRDTVFYHPHVNQKGNLCTGEHMLPIWNSLRSFDLVEAAMMIETVLNSYSEEHAYAPLKSWDTRNPKDFGVNVCGSCGREQVGELPNWCQVHVDEGNGEVIECRTGLCSECTTNTRRGKCANCGRFTCEEHVDVHCDRCGSVWCVMCHEVNEGGMTIEDDDGDEGIVCRQCYEEYYG